MTRWARRQPARADRLRIACLGVAERAALAVVEADSSSAASGAQKQFGAVRALDLRPPAVIIAPNWTSRETSP